MSLHSASSMQLLFGNNALLITGGRRLGKSRLSTAALDRFNYIQYASIKRVSRSVKCKLIENNLIKKVCSGRGKKQSFAAQQKKIKILLRQYRQENIDELGEMYKRMYQLN